MVFKQVLWYLILENQVEYCYLLSLRLSKYIPTYAGRYFYIFVNICNYLLHLKVASDIEMKNQGEDT